MAATISSTHLYAEALEKFQQAVLERHQDSNTRQLLDDFLLDGKSNFSTSDAASEAARKLATDIGERYSGIKFGKFEVVPKKWVDTILGNIDSIVAAGSLMTKAAPESVGMAWYAISLTLKAISNNYSLYALFGKGLTDITEVLIIIVHYDRLYDERQKSGFKASSLVDKLFRDTIAAYTAVLDFSFSVKKHMSGGAVDRLKHGVKDFFDLRAVKFKAKLADIADLKSKILENSEGAFQDKTIHQFDEVQAALRQIQQRESQALELQQEQKQALTAISENFKEFKDLVKRKMPWDVLEEEFIKNKKRLAPLPEPHYEINRLLKARQNGTCRWILADEKYRSWVGSDKSAILCLVGGSGSGKSVLLATLVQQFGETMNDLLINYVSCAPKDESQAAALGEQKLSRVCNTLLYQIYELATRDSDKIALLETCNQIFRNPKGHKAGPTSSRGSQNDGFPEFVDAMGQLVTAVQRDTVIVIDAVGILSREDQIELYKNLQELIGDPKLRRISILVSGRSDSAFIQRSLGTTACIEVSDGCAADREAVLDHRLRELPGWLDTERQLAKKIVLAKAGSRFNYIDDVALPYLKQPFQRPLSNYLRRLPEGLNESFEHAIRSMPQNYFELLQLTVTWCLLAPRLLTVKEVVEAYTGVYNLAGGDVTPQTVGVTEDSYDPNASNLEVQQISDAGGPFLSTGGADYGQTIVKLQDPRQVKTFCQSTVENDEVRDEIASQVCENCRSAIATRSSLAVDPKIAHFKIALTLLRHLNHPLFQQRFGLLKDSRTSDTVGDSSQDEEIEPRRFVPDQDCDDENSPTSVNNAAEDVETSDKPLENLIAVDDTDQNKPCEILGEQPEPEVRTQPGTDCEETSGDDADNYTEPSIDEELDVYDYIKDLHDDQGTTEAEWSLWECTPQLRCEINNWPYHLREAERLWPIHERKTSEIWTQFHHDVMEELKKFVDNQQIFYNWQDVWLTNRIRTPSSGGKFKPLHLATLLGLSDWVENLLDHGADINEISRGLNVSQTSGIFSYDHGNIDLLRLLLTRGADFYKALTKDHLPGFHLWLNRCNNLETVKAFVDHKIDFNMKDHDGWTGLHTFAWTGVHTESFNNIMCPDDPSKRPNINATDNNNETPLHRLLWRRDVPPDLLKAFLSAEGIDVNHDDRESQQPLGVASTWGSLNIVKLLLEANADVRDTNSYGHTPMHTAAQGDHVKCLEALLDAHSEIDTRDIGGSTPLQYAAYLGRKAAVEFLHSRGSDLHTTNNHNRTPFFNATRCRHGGQETAQYLLNQLKKSGCPASDINKITKGGRTPLRQAAHRGFAHVVKDLLEYIEASGDEDAKATINQADNKLKRTPLHCAARRGDPECVRLLFQYGGDAKLKDINGKTSLAIAQEQWAQLNVDSFEEVLLLLIDRDQQAAIDDPELPSIAAASGSVPVLEKLHSLRADLNRTDSLDWSPLAHAKHLGHTNAEAFLKYHSWWGGTLPSRWVYELLPSILDEQGTQVTCTGYQRICIVSDKPLPPTVERFYFEATIESSGDELSLVAIGFCTLAAEAHVFPGWQPKDTYSFATSWGYHSDDGKLFHRDRQFTPASTPQPYGAGDTVGCGVDLETHKMWFTKNGTKLDFEFENVRGRLYPILGLRGPLTLKTNFGSEDFEWKDI